MSLTKRLTFLEAALDVKPPTYPARPISGGPFDASRKPFGDWAYELKYNGWRALIHGPTGQMWNRHLKRLSIEKEFAVVLPRLAEVSRRSGVEWWDAEALERRHDFARGSLIILDCVVPDQTYAERQDLLNRWFVPADVMLSTNELRRTFVQRNGHDLWLDIPRLNGQRPGLVEGLVAKRTDSEYPFQLRRAEVTFPFWVKHRLHF